MIIVSLYSFRRLTLYRMPLKRESNIICLYVLLHLIHTFIITVHPPFPLYKSLVFLLC